MAQDQQTYRRATHAALLGLVVQLSLAVGVALLGLWSKSAGLYAATWHVVGGLGIWFILVLLYHQHKIERIEALEAEQLAQRDREAAALFQEHADDLDLARRRLDRLYKWGLNIVSLGVAAYLAGVGMTLFYLHYKQHQAGELVGRAIGEQAAENPLVMLFIAAGIAFLAFIVARYIAGMTKVTEWQLLRGGASYLMSTMVMALLIAGAALAVSLGSHQGMVYLALGIPAIMALVGLEILITFLLSAYRPRRPGEVSRPAFDSRVLGLLTAPESLAKIISEAINYQFGFEITSSWFYRLLAKAVTPMIVIGALILIGASSIVIVGPHEQAVVTRFGGITAIQGPGLHFKAPWPIGTAERYAVGRIHQINAGSSVRQTDRNVAILWTNQHTEGESEAYMITGPTPLVGRMADLDDADDDEGTAPGGLVAAEVVVHFQISDLEQYVRSADEPNRLVELIARRAVNSYFAGRDVDRLLASDRSRVGQTLGQQIQQGVDDMKLGIKIAYVGLTSVHPPQNDEVAEAFHMQIGALQEREAMVQEAEKDATQTLAEVAGSRNRALRINEAIRNLEDRRQALETLNRQGEVTADAREQAERAIAEAELEIEQLLAEARGEAASQIFEARAYRWQTAITERAKAERFQAELAAFRAAPRYYALRHYLTTLAEGLGQSRKFVISTEQTEEPVFRLDLKDAQSALDAILDGGN